MKQFGIAIFFLFICSGFTNQQSPLLKTFVPMGHNLDCADRCKTCIDENTFNEVYTAYTKTLTSVDRDFKDDAFQTLLIKKAAEKKNAVASRRKSVNSIDDNDKEEEKPELSDEEKIEKEVAKSEEMLDQEVKVAVEKVTKLEGEKNTDKIMDVANRIRSRMTEKYRKEAAKRLNIDYDSVKKNFKDAKEEKVKGKMLRKSGASASTSTSSKSKTLLAVNALAAAKQEDADSVYKVYFEICCESGNVFYARAPTA